MSCYITWGRVVLQFMVLADGSQSGFLNQAELHLPIGWILMWMISGVQTLVLSVPRVTTTPTEQSHSLPSEKQGCERDNFNNLQQLKEGHIWTLPFKASDFAHVPSSWQCHADISKFLNWIPSQSRMALNYRSLFRTCRRLKGNTQFKLKVCAR